MKEAKGVKEEPRGAYPRVAGEELGVREEKRSEA